MQNLSTSQITVVIKDEDCSNEEARLLGLPRIDYIPNIGTGKITWKRYKGER